MARPKKSSEKATPVKVVHASNNDKKKKISKINYGNFRRYIHTVLKQVHPDGRISKQAMTSVNDMMLDVFDRLARESANLAHLRKKLGKSKTANITSRDIQTAVRFILPGELAKHAQNEGLKAVSAYHKSRA